MTAVAEHSAAAWIARSLKARGVTRVFALCGGHVMPIWMRLDAEGIAIVDVRDERAAVYMAHAHAELTGGLGVALVTAGPGVTNAMTGIANAHVARAAVLVLSGVPPRPQENRGALQDMAHVEFVRPLTRYARTVREPSLVLQELDEACARALGDGGEPGPAFLDFPVDVLRAEVPAALRLAEHLRAAPRSRLLPDPDAVERAVELLWSARRALVISGRGARGAGPALLSLLERLNALYLDTGESRGLVPDDHPAVVAAMRGSVMAQADVVVTVGRKLDFQRGARQHGIAHARRHAGGCAALAQHLGDEERVASGRGVDAAGVAARDDRGEPLDGGARQRRHLQPRDVRRRQVAEDGAQLVERRGVVAVAEDEQCAGVADATAEVLDKVERRVVGPVHVLEDDDRRCRRPRQLVEHGGEERGAIARPRQRAAQRGAGRAGDVVERPERPRRRQRFARAPEHAAAAEPGGEALEQRRLADPRLAADEDGAAVTARRGIGSVAERREQRLALEQLARGLHRRARRPRAQRRGWRLGQ
jgi:hypothetical protein